MKDEDLEYHLEDPEDIQNDKKNSLSKKAKIILGSISILILLIIVIIICLKIKNDDDDDHEHNEDDDHDDHEHNEDDEHDESDIDYYEYSDNITSYINLSYADNNTILNSFKEGGSNYNENLGNINHGLDYTKSRFNSYNLYIPDSALNQKDKFNKIILLIHPGAWLGHNKEKLIPFCLYYAKMGYISATTGYTLLNQNDTDYNIFRILDEITATIINMKKKLIQKGFNENKLEMAIEGASAGGHLALLYAYKMKNISPIPIKFILNAAGPVVLEPGKYLKLKDVDNPLDSIDQKSIENAIKEGKLEETDGLMTPKMIVMLMNFFQGKKYSDQEIEEIFNDDDQVNKENEKYKDLLRLVQYAIPLSYVDKTTLPTLCLYGGKDVDVGVAQYSYLKEKFDENQNNNITLIYSKNADHPNVYADDNNKDGINPEYVNQFFNFSNLYFTSN